MKTSRKKSVTPGFKNRFDPQNFSPRCTGNAINPKNQNQPDSIIIKLQSLAGQLLHPSQIVTQWAWTVVAAVAGGYNRIDVTMSTGSNLWFRTDNTAGCESFYWYYCFIDARRLDIVRRTPAGRNIRTVRYANNKQFKTKMISTFGPTYCPLGAFFPTSRPRWRGHWQRTAYTLINTRSLFFFFLLSSISAKVKLSSCSDCSSCIA